MKKITIIIPTFNSSRYLDDALKSVEAQKLSNYEVIIVDDGSTIQEHNAYKKIITNYCNVDLVRKKMVELRQQGTLVLNMQLVTFWLF